MTDHTIQTIAGLQSEGCSNYPSGLFPSQRVHPNTKYCREDSNIFFSALIVFTLQELRADIPVHLHPIIDRLAAKVTANYPHYRHPADNATYNFWQDQPRGHFPNGRLLKRFSFMALPADADDTSLIYLTSNNGEDLTAIKKKLESHYREDAPISPLTPPDYLDLRAYPTFLGKRIKREWDVCVICNVLYLVFKNGLPLTATDFDSIELIRRVLEREDHIVAPFLVSPHYGNSAVILYHISRLVGSFIHREELHSLIDPLTKHLNQESERTESFMESLLISSSRLRLNLSTNILTPPDSWDQAFSNFFFFRAGLLTAFQNARMARLTSMPLFHLRYRCHAYYHTLWLEYLVLSNKH